MHIPDGFLDLKTWGGLAAVSAGTVGWAIARTNKTLGEKQVPVLGVSAAFIFAAQMLNFPVAGGTSGHFLGGALAAILLGPASGILVMTTVLLIQCLVFQDGGLTALGANIFNMGVLAVLTGWGVYALFAGKRNLISRVGAFLAGLVSVVIAASACAIELAFSGTVPLRVALPAMAGVHVLIGIGEGLITVAALELIFRVRPDLIGSLRSGKERS